jgi:hypothetical protein
MAATASLPYARSARLGLRATPEQEVVLYSLPVVILVRLAVSTQDQRRGIGFGLLQDARRWVG